MSYLIANLSIPANDEEKIKDAFQSALQWEYSQYVNPVYALFLIQAKTAVVYAQKELVEDLLKREPTNTFQLGGPLSTTFTSAEAFTSTLVEINFSDKSLLPDLQYDLLGSLREKLTSTNFTSFLKSTSISLRFNNQEDAAECVKLIPSLPESTTATGTLISIASHVALRAVWKGPAPLAGTIKRLKSTGQTLTSLVQSCLRYCCTIILYLIALCITYFL